MKAVTSRSVSANLCKWGDILFKTSSWWWWWWWWWWFSNWESLHSIFGRGYTPSRFAPKKIQVAKLSSGVINFTFCKSARNCRLTSRAQIVAEAAGVCNFTNRTTGLSLSQLAPKAQCVQFPRRRKLQWKKAAGLDETQLRFACRVALQLFATYCNILAQCRLCWIIML